MAPIWQKPRMSWLAFPRNNLTDTHPNWILHILGPWNPTLNWYLCKKSHPRIGVLMRAMMILCSDVWFHRHNGMIFIPSVLINVPFAA